MSPSEVVVQDHVRPVGPAPTSGLWSLFKVVALCIVFAVRYLADYVVGRGDIARANEYLQRFWRHVFRWGNAKLVVENKEVLEGPTMIVMTNHTSLLDVPTLLGAVPGSVRMVFKESLAKIPVFGWGLVAAGFVPIDRGNRAKAIAQLENAKRIFAKGTHVWVSPEGTRSRGKGLLPFKKGGFHLAKQLDAKIVPGFIEGTEQMISPTSLKVVQDGVVHVRYGAPIETQGKAVEALMAEVRAAIIALGVRTPAGTRSLGDAALEHPQPVPSAAQPPEPLGRSSAKRAPSVA